MEVRKMKLNEVFDVIRLQKQYWLFPSFFYFLAKGILARSAYVCIDNGKMSGLIIWSGNRIGSIVVDKDSKGKGIGSLLLEKTEPENPWAITVGDEQIVNFYIKNGYTVTSRNGRKIRLEKLTRK